MHRLTGTLAMLGVAAAAKPANMNGELHTSARLVWGEALAFQVPPVLHAHVFHDVFHEMSETRQT